MCEGVEVRLPDSHDHGLRLEVQRPRRVNSTLTPPEVTVFIARWLTRVALPHERRYVADLMPDAVVGLEESPACFFVATDSRDGTLVGAVVVRAMRDATGLLTGRVWIHVPQEYRRQGIGTALMESVFELADAENMSRLVMGHVVHEHHEFRPFFERLGMSPSSALITFENSFEDSLRVLEPLWARLSKRPHAVGLEHARPLYDLPVRATAEFAVEQHGGLVSAYEQKLRQRWYCARTSVGVQVGERVVGLLLARSRPESAFVDLRAVAKDFRRGPTNVLLMLTFARRAKVCGIETVVFEGDAERHPCTINLGERFQSTTPWRRFVYAIEPQAWQSRRSAGCPAHVTSTVLPIGPTGVRDDLRNAASNASFGTRPLLVPSA